MTMAPAENPGVDRLMTFDVAGTVFALPISDVLEVVEHDHVACIPGLSRETGGIMNWHGEALPVVAPHLLLGGDPIAGFQEDGTRQFLVVAEGSGTTATLGRPMLWPSSRPPPSSSSTSASTTTSPVPSQPSTRTDSPQPSLSCSNAAGVSMG